MKDCAGICGGDAIVGGCDNTCGSTTVKDCAGVCGGDAAEDCFGICNGQGLINECGICEIPNNNIYDCSGNCLLSIDCNGTCGGKAKINKCGICTENNYDNKNCLDVLVLEEFLNINPQLNINNPFDLGVQRWNRNGNLVFLSINKTNLKFIPESISDLKNLEELSLDKNQIENLPLSICGLNNTFISASKNKICDINTFDCVGYKGRQFNCK